MKIYLFDIDGTLILSGGAGGKAMRAAASEEFGTPPPSREVPAAGRTDRAIVGDLFEVIGVEDTEQNRSRFLDRYLQHLPTALAECDGRILPAVNSVLDQLAARDDVALGVLTGNLEAGAKAKLSHYQLSDYFAFGGFGDNHVHRNDVARLALDAARSAAETISEVIVIGDTPADIECGRAIEATTIAVMTGGCSREKLAASLPDILLKDLSELVI